MPLIHFQSHFNVEKMKWIFFIFGLDLIAHFVPQHGVVEAIKPLNYGWFKRYRRPRGAGRPALFLSNSAPYLSVQNVQNRPRRRPVRRPQKSARFNPSPYIYDADKPQHFTRPISPITNPKDNFHVPEFFPEIPPFRENYPRIPPPKEYPDEDLRPQIPNLPVQDINEIDDYQINGGKLPQVDNLLEQTFGKSKPKFNNYLIHHKRNILPDEGQDNIRIFPKLAEFKKNIPAFNFESSGPTIQGIADAFKFDMPGRQEVGFFKKPALNPDYHPGLDHHHSHYDEPEQFKKPFKRPEVFRDPEVRLRKNCFYLFCQAES